MPVDIAQRIENLSVEVAELRALVGRGDADGADVTPFHGWRVRDSIGHMVTIDELATLSFSDPDAFAAALADFAAGTAPDDPKAPRSDSFRRIARYENERLGALSWPDLLDRWQTGFASLTDAAGARAGDERVPWFGGTMKAESLLAARHMEVWAYGQDVFDGYHARRHEGDRIRNVVEFGLKTFGFSFANRGEPAPAAKPHVVLTAPGGEIWRWNDPESNDRVEGDAADFCLVATQRRHVEDTELAVTGEIAGRWMQIAQCIAGPPLDGPRAGERRW